MCNAQRSGRAHEKLEQMRGSTGYLMKSAGGSVKSTEDKQLQTERPAVQPRALCPHGDDDPQLHHVSAAACRSSAPSCSSPLLPSPPRLLTPIAKA
eukprot:scaffold306012_cov36-Tisochrysis_lutea.AAC.3